MPDQDGKLGVGIRGAGQVAVEHAKAIKNNPRLYTAAVCSRRKSSAQKLVRTHAPEADVYERYEELLDAKEVDVVSICMPNFLHAPEAIQALNANKHLILEKPPAITFEELQELRNAARSSSAKSVVSFVMRWHPMAQRLREYLAEDAIGEIYYVESDYWHGIKHSFSSYEWIRKKEYAGGAMITGGCHAADIARYLSGKEVSEVSAYSCRSRTDFDYPTTLVSSVRFTDGSVGKLSASLDGLYFPYQLNIDLLGSKGAIRDNRISAPDVFADTDGFVELDVETPNSGSVSHHPFQQEIDNLADSVFEGTAVVSDVLDACKSIEISLAIEKSAAEGKPIAIAHSDGA